MDEGLKLVIAAGGERVSGVALTSGTTMGQRSPIHLQFSQSKTLL